MANGQSDRGTGNTAIVAIVVLVLVAVVVFMIFFWNGGGPAEEPASGPDVELEATPPENGENAPNDGDAGTGGAEGGVDDAAGESSAGE